ncbi:GNAT family N-acetyltransferase [Candidatus Woesearchaeota archaeon]|nr:GNAT family N-acetyltransferase [Candidatus Woesearchaeota archaeon]
MIPVIKSKLFTLRPFRRGDEHSLQKSINSRNVTKHTVFIPYPYTMKHSREWVAKNISFYRKKKKTEVNFAIGIGGEVAGGIGLRYIEGRKAELGYWLAEKHWGKGIMTTAVGLVTDYAVKQLRLRRLYATVFTSNKASARVLEKSGFRVEGKLRRFHKKGGRLFDALLYAKVR